MTRDDMKEALEIGSSDDSDYSNLRCSTLQKIEIFLESWSDEGFKRKLKKSIEILEETFVRYKAEKVCLSFNGGKDCTVLLHLAEAIRIKIQPSSQALKTLHVVQNDLFPELLSFVEQCSQWYNLPVVEYQGSIKDALKNLKVTLPILDSFLIGTRRTDPYSCSLDYFQMTDSDWPQFMRVNPLLDWDYKDVWIFLKELNLPYCKLYDEGYTSIGNRANTLRNPSLKYFDEHGNEKYKPAYLLNDTSNERQGRL